MSSSSTATTTPLLREIPEKVLIGYASHNYTNVRSAVMDDGVNVVIWAFMDIVQQQNSYDNVNDDNIAYENLEETVPILTSKTRDLQEEGSQSINSEDSNSVTNVQIRTSLDLPQIQQFIQQLDTNGYSHVLHLVSFGGWNGPHLDTSLSASDWYNLGWKGGQQYQHHQPHQKSHDSLSMNHDDHGNSSDSSLLSPSDIFHGIDWDLEGHDNLTSPTNVFTVECLEMMGEISRLMKGDGYVVTMAPPQSYLNLVLFDDTDTTSNNNGNNNNGNRSNNFSRYVNLTIPDRRWHPEFHYFGRNVYAYLLARYGSYIDLISIQFYESYSDAAMSVYHDGGMTGEEYLFNYVRNLVVTQNQSFHVDFSQDSSLNIDNNDDDGTLPNAQQRVELPLSKLVIGLANGWALDANNSPPTNGENNDNDQQNNKVLYISSMECQRAYLRLRNCTEGDLTPRGFMFWTIEERGTRGVYLARDIGAFL